MIRGRWKSDRGQSSISSEIGAWLSRNFSRILRAPHAHRAGFLMCP